MRNRSPLCACTLSVLLIAQSACAASTETAPTQVSTQAKITDCRIGFANHYKVGFWTPVWIDIHGSDGLESPRVEVTTVDSDGIETRIPSALSAATAQTGASKTHVVHAKIGRLRAPIHVTLFAGAEVVDEMILDPTSASAQKPVLDALPAVSELVVSFGGGENGLTNAFPNRVSEGRQVARRVVKIDDIATLPDAWFGYESVDLFILSTDDVQLCRALAADEKRLAALKKWIELGGRLILFAEGANSEELFAEGRPLSALLPGKLGASVTTAEMTPLEQYADASEGEPISRPGSRAELMVPQLVEVNGVIEAYIGPRPTALPLIVRGPLGMGEVAFVGFSLAKSPLAEWKGRSAFWRAVLRPYMADIEPATNSQMLSTLGYNDLSGALRQRMGRSFAGVTPVPFSTVAVLSVAYILLLGPASYWIAHRSGGREEVAWVFFPLLVLCGTGAAFWYGQKSKSDSARINELELVDCDQTTGRARGTYWGVMYSPESMRFDLGLDVKSPTGSNSKPVGAAVSNPATGDTHTLLSWWGLPGTGIGGMQAGGVDLTAIEASYRFAPALNALDGLPILTGATKSLFARWAAPIETLIENELADDDGMLAGSLANDTGTKLINARLLYGTWAYRLGDVAVGEQVEVGQHLDPIKVQTLVTQMARGNSAPSYADRGRFLVERATTDELLAAMMFYRAAGGESFAELPNQYQSYFDMSRLVELGRAVLVAEVESDGSQIVNPANDERLAPSAGPRRVMHRFVMPVEKSY